jgi:hypothetical protein
MAILIRNGRGDWPELPYAAWKDTCETLHMYLQIIGKVRLALAPKCNQWWHVPFYVTPRGLTTSAMAYGHRAFEVRFDFIDHSLILETSEGARGVLPLEPRTVADFYEQIRAMLRDVELDTPIWPHPVEVPDGFAFDEDTVHGAYDREPVERFFTITRQINSLFNRFRAQFRGKCSPVQLYWGSFDLAVTRFSGRRAPPRPGADNITADAYDEEVSSVGFWPGNEATGGPMLYAYTVPEPFGFAEAHVYPEAAFYSRELKELLLPYDAVRTADDPDATVLQFAESAYLAGAMRSGWDVDGLRYGHADAEPALAGINATAR